MSASAPLIAVFVFMLATMTLSWLTQRATNNAGWVDAFWTFGTGASCVAVALWPASPANQDRQLLVAALAAIWSLRLGFYIATRVAGSKTEDVRYATLRQEWGRAFQIRLFGLAIVQAPASALLSWSAFAATHSSDVPLHARDGLGVAVLIVAIAGEAIADEQMRRFKVNRNHGAINDTGLWSWSRHPNYFFEWLGWLAYPTIAFDPASPASWVTWIAPVQMYLLLRYGTGVPIVEQNMLKSRGDVFRAYQARVSAFFPLPPKQSR